MIHRFRSEIDVDILPPLFFLLIRFSLSHFSARGKKQTGIYADFRVGRNKRETRNIELLETKAEFFHIFESIRGDIGANRRDYFWFGSVMMIGGALKYCFNIGVCTRKSEEWRPLVGGK